MVSNAEPDAPPRAHEVVQLRGHLALRGALSEPGQDLGEGAVGHRGRSGHTGDLLGRLGATEPLHQPGRRHEIGPGEPLAGEGPIARPADVVGLQRDAAQPGDGLDDGGSLVGAAVGDHHPAVDAGLPQLGGRLRGVAAVGDDQQVVGREHHDHGGTAEAGEPAPVRQIGEHERLAGLRGGAVAALAVRRIRSRGHLDAGGQHFPHAPGPSGEQQRRQIRHAVRGRRHVGDRHRCHLRHSPVRRRPRRPGGIPARPDRRSHRRPPGR